MIEEKNTNDETNFSSLPFIPTQSGGAAGSTISALFVFRVLMPFELPI
jgi:hypothetical protein